MKSHILIVLICAFLVGCSFDMPAFDAGKLEHHVSINGRDRSSTSALSKAQLSALNDWFTTHQSGWKKSYVDVAPVKFAYLSRQGASVAYFNLSGNTLYAASYSRTLTLAERQALEKILDEKNG
jgi:hypothetical protein